MVVDDRRLGRVCAKTRMCRFVATGTCHAGASCNYAHSHDELQHAPDLTRTKMCPRVLQGGECFNPRCTYAHRRNELRKVVLREGAADPRWPPSGDASLKTPRAPPSPFASESGSRRQRRVGRAARGPRDTTPPARGQQPLPDKMTRRDSTSSDTTASNRGEGSERAEEEEGVAAIVEDAMRPLRSAPLPMEGVRVFVKNTFVHATFGEEGGVAASRPPRRASSVPRGFAPAAAAGGR